MNHVKVPADNVEEVMDLTPTQAGILYQCLREPEQQHYHVSVRLVLSGELSLDRLTTAYASVVAAHGALRTVFRWQSVSRPVQLVLRRHVPSIEFFDCRDASDQESATTCQRFLSRPLDLTEVPFRLAVISSGSSSHELLVVYHHIVCDGWSIAVVVRELLEAYAKASPGPGSLAARSAFKDYVKRCRRPAPRATLEYWQRHWEDAMAPQSLALRRQSEATSSRTRWEQRLAPDLEGALAAFCQRNSRTRAAVMFACWALLLARYNDSDEVTFGTAVSGRGDLPAAAKDAVGCFVATLPLRVRVRREERFVELVARMASELAERSSHELISPTEMRRVASAAPDTELFDTVVAVENYPLGAVGGAVPAGLTLRAAHFEERSAYPLTLIVQPGETTSLTLLSDGSVLTEAVERVLQHFMTLLRWATGPSGAAVDDCVIASDEERRVLGATNQTERAYSVTVLHAAFESRAIEAPSARAAFDAGRSLTYAELNAQANRVARRLRALGVGRNDIVAIGYPRSLEFIIGALGVLKAGGAYLPLDLSSPALRVRAILDDSKPKVVLVAAALDGVECLALAGHELEAESGADLAPCALANDLAYVIYTSGSTGQPKGVAIRHHSVVNRLEWMQREYGFGEADVLLQKTPVTFDVSVWELFLWTFAGASVRVLPEGAERDPRLLNEAVQSAGVTTLHFVPSMLSAWLTYLGAVEDVAPLRSLRRVFASGEALELNVVKSFQALLGAANVGLINLYGPTEATVDVSYYDATRHESGPVPIGRPIQNTQLHVVTRSGRPQPIGVPGELVIGGVGLAAGYLNNPEKTAARFVPSALAEGERLYWTGDIARWRADGQLEYLGRKDNQIKIRGYRIELGEIEQQMLQLPNVTQAVAAVRHGPSTPELVAFYEGGVSPGEVAEFMRARLPAYMLPAQLRAVTVWPLTSSGKVDRSALLRQLTSERAPVEDRPQPAGTSGAAAELCDAVKAAWEEVLPGRSFSVHDRFFDVGGDSISLIRLMSLLVKRHGPVVTIPKLTQYPTIEAFAGFLVTQRAEARGSSVALDEPRRTEAAGAVAIVGMAARFPGARDVRAFWDVLCAARCAVIQLDPDELAREVDAEQRQHPRYVPFKGLLEDVDMFDAAFFGYGPVEANGMDPQLRVLHECVWHSLEDAGIDPERATGGVGLFVGASPNYHWVHAARGGGAGFLSDFNLMLLNEKDFFSGRISHKLNLLGPSVTVQTACSTSAVAIHEACNALNLGHCRAAVAGGVSVTYPVHAGYIYEQGMVLSPDGRCRPFDVSANGTVPGNGVGALVLKRLDDALADGNTIYAVIKGSAINNDGSYKLGFTAPSVSGQVRCIRAALARAGVASDQISYVEAHGTGTALGDPIELDALMQAFGAGMVGSCAVGSVKGNIGHLDAAAGVASVIKTALALHHGVLPPTLHHERTAEGVDLANSRFRIQTERQPWSRVGSPRRAGVSSFGMSGTNCHLVLEEAPSLPVRQTTRGVTMHLLPLSARDTSAVDDQKALLNAALAGSGSTPLEDIAYTLQTGRRAFEQRVVALGSTREEVQAALSVSGSRDLISGAAGDEPASLVMLFQGQGRSVVGLGAALADAMPEFRRLLERRFDYLLQRHALSRHELFAESDSSDGAMPSPWAPLALLVFQSAFTELMTSHGVRPSVVAGHSVGEYAAALAAGVFSLEAALDVIHARCRLMNRVAPGAMLVTDLSEPEAMGLARDGVCLAAVNAEQECVLSGEGTLLARVGEELERRGRLVRWLPARHAFHSVMLDPILDDLRRVLEKVELREPRIELITSTREPLAPERIASVDYWVAQTRNTVYFSSVVERLARIRRPALIEVGAKPILLSHVLKRVTSVGAFSVASTDREGHCDARTYASSLARLWVGGVDIDWRSLHSGPRTLVSLPGYPFRRTPHPVAVTAMRAPEPVARKNEDAEPGKHPQADRPGFANWFYVPSWRREPAVGIDTPTLGQAPVLCFDDDAGFGFSVARGLFGDRVIRVRLAREFERDGRGFSVNPADASGLDALLASIGTAPAAIVHSALLREPTRQLPSPLRVRSSLDHGFYGLMGLVQALARRSVAKLDMLILTNNCQDVVGNDCLCPDQATVLGIAKVLPVEHPEIRCCALDLDFRSGPGSPDAVSRAASAALSGRGSAPVRALRNGALWSCGYMRISPPPPSPAWRIPAGGVYLITGGLGGIGLVVAAHLARAGARHISLVSRTGMAPPGSAEDEVRAAPRRRAVRELEELGVSFAVHRVDLADPDGVRSMVAEIHAKHGGLDAIFHAAGVPDYCGLLQTRDRQNNEAVLAPKVAGTINLLEACAEQSVTPELMVSFSSIGNIAHELKYGQSGYNAANEFLDAVAGFAGALPVRRVISINWPDWRDVGMSTDSAKMWARQLGLDEKALLEDAIDNGEGLAALGVCLSAQLPQVAVSPISINRRRETARRMLSTILAGRSGTVSPTAALRDPQDLRAAINAACREVLGSTSIDHAKSFFDMGASSFDLIRINSLIQERLGREVSLLQLYEHPTVDALAEFLEAGGADSARRDASAGAADMRRQALPNTLRALREKGRRR